MFLRSVFSDNFKNFVELEALYTAYVKYEI